MNITLTTTIALLKRESWEHRAFWIVPTVMAVLLLLVFLWAVIYAIPHSIGYDLFVDRLSRAQPEALERLGAVFIPGLAAPFFVMMGFVIAFYLLDALYTERRDRSILFWKSLPVTDTTTVMSKWGAVLIVFPLIVFAVVVVLSLVLTFLAGIVTMIGGGNPWTLVWQHYGLFSGLGTLLIGFYVEALWYLPVLGWLLLASAWAKKAPFLWATLPPVALIVIEEMFFDTNYFLRVIGERLVPFEGSKFLSNQFEEEFEMFDGKVQFSGTTGADFSFFGELLTTPGFWYGLVFAAACTAGAVWLRRYRDES